jgi:hypothetical protein
VRHGQLLDHPLFRFTCQCHQSAGCSSIVPFESQQVSLCGLTRRLFCPGAQTVFRRCEVEEDCFCHANNVWDPAVSRVGWISVAVGDFGAAHTTNGERKAIARTGKGKTAKDQLFLSLRDLTSSRSPVTVCACGLQSAIRGATPQQHETRPVKACPAVARSLILSP